MSGHMTSSEFSADQNVARETMERLEVYMAALQKWNKAINLVGKSSLDDPWRRHFLDSAQLLDLIPHGAKSVLDVGSGAGFPGLVLAILSEGRFKTHLCESDGRKATFLREVGRLTKTEVAVTSARIEDLSAFPVDIITARALAPIVTILDWCEDFIGEGTQLLLLKGNQTHNELTEAEKTWNIRAELIRSRSDKTGLIAHITQATRHDRAADPRRRP
jgi:16S rRNA (guanine527-N7)-methyltransferase